MLPLVFSVGNLSANEVLRTQNMARQFVPELGTSLGLVPRDILSVSMVLILATLESLVPSCPSNRFLLLSWKRLSFPYADLLMVGPPLHSMALSLPFPTLNLEFHSPGILKVSCLVQEVELLTLVVLALRWFLE